MCLIRRLVRMALDPALCTTSKAAVSCDNQCRLLLLGQMLTTPEEVVHEHLASKIDSGVCRREIPCAQWFGCAQDAVTKHLFFMQAPCRLHAMTTAYGDGDSE